jgi:Na+/proline symporter
MSSRTQLHSGLIALSLVVATALFALISEYRPDGVLGTLQNALQFLFVIPYVVGIVLGGTTTHNSNAAGVFLGLFVEVYILTIIGWRIVRSIK